MPTKPNANIQTMPLKMATLRAKVSYDHLILTEWSEDKRSSP